MKRYEIYNAAKRDRRPCAHLVYDEAKGKMRILIAEDVSPADLPLMLALFAQRGKRTVPDKSARAWVAERIPPEGRQNLGEILRANGLAAYDMLALLEVAEGRSAQDDFLVRKALEPETVYAAVKLPAAHGPQQSLCESLGQQIARKRKKAGMTQADLAEKTGIDQAAISRIEKGRANPTLNTLDALAKGVGAALAVGLA